MHVPDDELPPAGTMQTYTGTTTSSGTLTPTSCQYSSSGASGEDVYYWAQCAGTRSYAANTCTGTSYDTAIHIRHNGAQIGCDDDSCASGLGSMVSGSAVGAGVVQVIVDGYGTASGSYSLALTL